MTTKAAMDDRTRVTPAPNVHARPVGDDLVLLDFAEGDYFGLDAIGSLVWRGIVAGRALGAIAQEIAANYDVSTEQALSDVVRLVTDLESRSLIRRL